jgi:hypothetical protein
MPLSTTEVKNLLKDVFRLVIALNKDDQTQALSAFSSILDTAITDEYADMPTLEQVPAVSRTLFRPIHADMSELEEVFRPSVPRAPVVAQVNHDDDVHLVISEKVDPDDELSVIEQSEVINVPDGDDEEVEAVEIDEYGNEVPAEEEAAADEEEAAADEEVELDLEPVRIRKVIYWKDKETGDLYQYLPDDEVGDKVGSYVNGVPVFE